MAESTEGKTEDINLHQGDSITKAGVAKLKKEFILSSEKRQHDAISEPEVKRARLEKKEKRRRRGQNKGRGVPWKEQREAALCPTMADVPVDVEFPSKCGQEHCKLQHDVIKFLAAKPPDLGISCPLYQQFGRCPRGAACRYGKEHLTEDGHNIVNTAVYNAEQKPSSVNQLGKDLQFSLRKFKYNFTSSEKILADIRKEKGVEAPSANGKQDAEKDVSSVTEVKIINPSNSMTPDTSIEKCIENKVGPVSDEDQIRLRQGEKRKITWKDQLYLSPLTTVGNLPFRRLCRSLGADVTCGEMAMASSLLQGVQQEWALVRRHESEKLFGVQICGSNPQTMARCAQLLQEKAYVDFVDINMGCPIDLVYQQGGGSGLLRRRPTLQLIVQTLARILDVPLTIKTRTGVSSDKNIAHTLMPSLHEWNVSLVTLHGRSREQRYTRSADWAYIDQCAKLAAPVPLFGNGDILSYEDYNLRRENTSISGVMIGRGALIKPWIFTEIKEQRHWDISSGERLDLLKKYTNFALEHWGSDTKGVETTRRFLLEWLSFLHRYIPVGLLEAPPQKINERPPAYRGRDDLETLMISSNCTDWVKISEMLVGKVPEGFNFLPKHKANAWQ